MVSVEPLTPDGFQIVSDWLSDPAINRWLTSEWRGRQVAPAVIAMAVRNRRNRLFIIKCDAEPYGLVGFADIDEVDRTAMVWYLRGHSERVEKGVISRAVGKAVQWAFDELRVVSVYAWIMADNQPSRRVLERNEFQPAGRIRLSARSGDRQVDRVYFDRLNPAEEAHSS